MEQEISNDVLRLQSPVYTDNSIESKQLKEFIPLSKADFNILGHTIEIKIPASDAYYIPSESFIEIKGKVVRGDNDQVYPADTEIAIINNAVMYMFSSIQYRLGGKEMERLNFPGHTTSMLGYLSYPDDFNSSAGLKQCWAKDTSAHADSNRNEASAEAPAANYRPAENANYNAGFAIRRKLLMSADPRGNFSFIIPFQHIFGFAEYDKVLYNLEHILQFTRGSDTLPLYRGNNVNDGKITLTDIRWCIPEVKPSMIKRIELLELVKNKTIIPLNFSARSDDHTTVNENVQNFEWMLNMAAGIEKPRWIIVAMQTDKIRTQEQNPAVFDYVNLSSACVNLNGDRYPSHYLDINFAQNDYTRLYEMAEEFKREYYGFNNLIGGTQIDFLNYKSLFPIIVFDVRHQSERVRSGVMTIKLELKFRNAVPAQTHLYSLVISDRLFRLTSDGQTPRMESY